MFMGNIIIYRARTVKDFLEMDNGRSITRIIPAYPLECIEIPGVIKFLAC
jgi:hypothetical protein